MKLAIKQHAPCPSSREILPKAQPKFHQKSDFEKRFLFNGMKPWSADHKIRAENSVLEKR